MPYSAAMPSRLPTRQQSLAETPPAAPTERPAVRAYRLQLQRVDKLRAQLSDIDTLAQWQRDERGGSHHPAPGLADGHVALSR